MNKFKKIKLISIMFCILLTLTACSEFKHIDNVQDSNNNINNNFEKEPNSNTIVYFFDVEQADCTLIINNNETLLIDTGDISTKDEVLQYLEDVGIEKINYLILTHPHADHIGAAPEIINKYKIDNILMPNKTTTSNIFEKTLDAIGNNGYKITIPNRNDKFNIGDGYFTILSDQTIDWGDDLNYSSLSLKVTFGEIDLIFTGDADKEVEEDILKANLSVDAEILKIGHHGSYTATSNEFLSKVSPQYAIISCGEDNKYGHPHIETIDKLNKNKIKFYRTDLNHTIKLSINNNNIDVFVDKIVENEIPEQENITKYILNTNSKKIHLESCKYAQDILDKNKSTHKGDYSSLLDEGYTTCKTCIGG